MIPENLREELLNLPPMRDTVRDSGFTAEKKLGQHFLFDLNITNKIVKAAGNLSEFPIIEIGPGPGALTRSLFLSGAEKVIAIDKDERVIKSLAPLKEILKDRLEIVIDDALKIREEDYGKKVKVVSNLPYNISTELLFKWLEKPESIASMTLMFQKEVAERIVSEPNKKSYGKISVISQWLCEAHKIFDLPSSAFVPPPKVDSTVINLTPLAAPRFKAERDKLEKILNACFQQRRKMLRVSLKKVSPDAENILNNVGINPELRPEDLTVEQFCKLAGSF